MQYYYNPQVVFLLMDHSEEKEEMEYGDNLNKLKVPLIGKRPPYYIHPRYEQYDPVI